MSGNLPANIPYPTFVCLSFSLSVSLSVCLGCLLRVKEPSISSEGVTLKSGICQNIFTNPLTKPEYSCSCHFCGKIFSLASFQKLIYIEMFYNLPLPNLKKNLRGYQWMVTYLKYDLKAFHDTSLLFIGFTCLLSMWPNTIAKFTNFDISCRDRIHIFGSNTPLHSHIYYQSSG